MKIGNFTTKNNVFLAPLAGVTDLPFRLLCKALGCGMMTTEMVSAKGLVYKNKNTTQLLHIHEAEHPIGVQLFGSEPDIMAQAVRMLEPLAFDFIDINMGCPVPKIFNNGEGSALLKDPQRIEAIVKAVSSATQKPVTVKIRKGVDENSVNCVEVAKRIEAGGGAAVAVHGRVRAQYYSGQADWDCIRQVKEAVSIPVIGNGDVTNPETAKQMLEETGCDGVMIGRAAMGNPWIFQQVATYLETGKHLPPPSSRDRMTLALRHMDMLVAYKGPDVGVREMRKHMAWYTKGLPHAAHIRNVINQAETPEQLKQCILPLLLLGEPQ